jgi:hypothetical protein
MAEFSLSNSLVSSAIISDFYIGDWPYPDSWWYRPYTTWTVTSPATVYKYQIECPSKSCKTSIWAEVNKIVTCPKCKNTIRVVNEDTTFTVVVKETPLH